MFKRLPVLIVIASLCGSPLARGAGAETFVLDTLHSQVVFFADHQGFSHSSGRLRIKQGWFQFDEKDWSNARCDVLIDLGSVDMGEAKWSATVAKRFFDVNADADAHFVCRQLRQTSPRSGILTGELWLHGQRQDIDLELSFNRSGGDPYAFAHKAGFSARTTLDRFAFGIDAFRDMVGANVEVRIEVEGKRQRKAIEEKTDGPQEH